MTDHLHALAMRTKAAIDIGELGDDLAYISDFGQRLSERAYEISREILALPLEADHAALVAEAVKLPEIAALVRDVAKGPMLGALMSSWINERMKQAAALLALDTP